jgi:DNA-binding response OmpR family regulator
MRAGEGDTVRERILVVEDDDAIAAFVVTALEREGYTVAWVRTGRDALSHVEGADRNSRAPDLVLLDLMLPDDADQNPVDGLQVCRTIRRGEIYIPIIMVTAKDEDVDKVVGLELGADDYITKPFNTRELLARVRAVLRLAGGGRASRDRERLRIGIRGIDPLEIDLAGRVVQVGSRPVTLTPKEFDLLVVLARNRGRVFGRATLLQQVWGYDYLGDSRTVDVHVQRLRRKLEPDPHHPRFLLTVHGIGYKFAAGEG